ncbi:hypothetical protein MCOR11_007316 [Pyricularia oryzae]|nr:hypothetical protein MCOR11_007316 [Pyricularia oryzae]
MARNVADKMANKQAGERHQYHPCYFDPDERIEVSRKQMAKTPLFLGLSQVGMQTSYSTDSSTDAIHAFCKGTLFHILALKYQELNRQNELTQAAYNNKRLCSSFLKATKCRDSKWVFSSTGKYSRVRSMGIYINKKE